MFQGAAIDIAIGLVVMYLVLSLVCTVINEFVAMKLDLRSKSLAAGLHELLDDPVVRNAFYDHGLIAGTKNVLAKVGQLPLTRSAFAVPASSTQPGAASEAVAGAPAVAPARTVAAPARTPADVGASAPAAPVAATQPGEHPSYLSAETFVLALVGSLTGTRLAEGQQVPGFADVQSAIQNLPPSKIKSALLASLITAQGDFDAFRKSVATWFDDSMERLSGAYKRHLKFISIIVGCAVAVIINADTFEVGKALWSDSALRAQLVQAADATATGRSATPSTAGPPTQAADIANAFKTANDKLRPLPIGWPACTQADTTEKASNPSVTHPECPKQDGGSAWPFVWLWFYLFKACGWFVTGLALSLGAPFWFDTLSKFMNVRGTGVKPKRQT